MAIPSLSGPTSQGELSRENPTSLYEQIAGRLQAEIEAGHYEPSGRLPSETRLGERFQVSRVTVRLALDKLTSEGRIVRRQGKGSYVAGKQVRHGLDSLRSFHESLLQQGLNASMRLLFKESVEVPGHLRQHFASSDRLLKLERLHLVDDSPVALGVSYLPEVLNAADWVEIEREPAYSLIGRLMGQSPARADMAIRAQLADATIAGVLHGKPGDALLVLERTSYLGTGQCCDHSSFYVRPERYAFVLSSVFPIQG